MAKHFSAWVIVTGATPTAFRSRYREDLLPTLHQLQRKEPDTRLAWFERNRFWDSPEAARAALAEREKERGNRGRDWRPGGQHEDPRARYQLPRDEKRARFKKRMQRDFADGRRRPENDEGSGAQGRKPDTRAPGKQESDSRGPDHRPPWKQRPPGRRPDGPGTGKRPGGSSSGPRRRSSGEGSGPRGSKPEKPRGRTGGKPERRPGGRKK